MICECPNCGITIEIIEINCGIFRCGIYKHNGQQLPPHATKEECEQSKDLIWGCSKPFKIDPNGLTTPQPCDYC